MDPNRREEFTLFTVTFNEVPNRVGSWMIELFDKRNELVGFFMLQLTNANATYLASLHIKKSISIDTFFDELQTAQEVPNKIVQLLGRFRSNAIEFGRSMQMPSVFYFFPESGVEKERLLKKMDDRAIMERLQEARRSFKIGSRRRQENHLR